MIFRNYFGYRLIQREDSDTVPFFIFFARAKDIRQWTGVRRVKDSDEGTQRILRPTRRKAITRFLSSYSKNTIPNNILLAFGPEAQDFEFTSLSSQLQSCFSEEGNRSSIFNDCGSQVEWGHISFSFNENAPEEDKPALIVDGQHRLYGISDYADENLPLLIVSLLNAPLQEQAFQFVVINNKAVRVPTDNVRAIIAQVDEDEHSVG
jgi:DGQHR domain-containing protein